MPELSEARLKEIETEVTKSRRHFDPDGVDVWLPEVEELVAALRNAWRERDEFVKDCNDALDRLGAPIENEGVSGQISVWRRIERIGGLQRELKSLIMWGGQIHDALDGRPLPFLPDEAAARIIVLRNRAARAEAEVEQLKVRHKEFVDTTAEVLRGKRERIQQLQAVREAAEEFVACRTGMQVAGRPHIEEEKRTWENLRRALDLAKDPAR